MQDTGYYIDKRSGRIRGPAGYTGFRVNNRKHVVGKKGDTRHYIYRDYIYSTLTGNTGFCVRDGRIFGPSSQMPWEKR